MAQDTVIKVEGLWKRYGLPSPKMLLNRLIGREADSSGPWALREINLEITRGETFGILGRNGAGKSTLLKVLAGVTLPTRGNVEVTGRIFPMIELNAGLNPELTGRENVKLLGSIMGLTRSEMEDKLPGIEDFTELGEWFDKPVRTYSSGMLGRLGFGVAVNIESDVILIDETFAVGDLRFQNKSLARMQRLRESGATILLVSHSLETLQFVSSRGILLEQGRLLREGEILETITQYESLVFRSEQKRLEKKNVQTPLGVISVIKSEVLDTLDTPANEIHAFAPFSVHIELSIREQLADVEFRLKIFNAAGILCRSNIEHCAKPIDAGNYKIRVAYPENDLSTGAYEIQLEAAVNGRRIGSSSLTSFSVVGPKRSRGVIAGACEWDFVRYTDAQRTSTLNTNHREVNLDSK